MGFFFNSIIYDYTPVALKKKYIRISYSCGGLMCETDHYSWYTNTEMSI